MISETVRIKLFCTPNATDEEIQETLKAISSMDSIDSVTDSFRKFGLVLTERMAESLLEDVQTRRKVNGNEFDYDSWVKTHVRSLLAFYKDGHSYGGIPSSQMFISVNHSVAELFMDEQQSEED